MENKRKREGVSTGERRLRKSFLTFTRCSRRVLLCVDGLSDDQGHGVMVLLALQCLCRYLFAYLRCEFFRRVSTRLAVHCLPLAFFNLIGFVFSYSEEFLSCFPYFFLILAPDSSARVG